MLGAEPLLGVLIASSNSEWWSNVPTFPPVTVTSASITLPFLRCQRNQTIQGNPSITLDSYLKDAPFQVPADTVSAATDRRFPVPPPLSSC